MANKKVLVVDDEVHILHVVAIKLRNNGFDVVTAQNGSDALEIIKEQSPDMIVTDYKMPGMTGLEMIQKIRESHLVKAVPVVMLTARGFAVDPEQLDEYDIAEFLSKPFSPKELLRIVEDVLFYRESAVKSD